MNQIIGQLCCIHVSEGGQTTLTLPVRPADDPASVYVFSAPSGTRLVFPIGEPFRSIILKGGGAPDSELLIHGHIAGDPRTLRGHEWVRFCSDEDGLWHEGHYIVHAGKLVQL